MQVRILDTTAPGTVAHRGQGRVTSGPIGRHPSPPATRSSPRTAPRSSPRPASTRRAQRPRRGYVQIAEYSARTGKPLFHEDRFSASIGWQEVLWASPDGSALVISDPRGVKTRYGGRTNILGVLAGNKFTPIPHGAYNGLFFAW